MFQTQRFMIACLALLLGVGLGVLISNQIKSTNSATDFFVDMNQAPIDATAQEFKTALAVSFELSTGGKLEEATPGALMQTFPAILSEDFNGVETVLGKYEYRDGKLTETSVQIVDAAADDITDAGIKTLRDNIYRRLNLDIRADLREVLLLLSKTPNPATATTTTISTACTLDAQICPDGSAVGRAGPNCEFAACPDTQKTATPTEITCTAEQKSAEACIELYAPVCAAVQIQCVTTPCEPIPKTFSNSCFACAEQSVTSYHEGACINE
jgi:hypothetical protein